MNKLVAAIVVSAFAFSSTAGFAADTAMKKKEELTKDERVEMRNRAEALTAQRAAQGTMWQNTAVTKTPKAHKKHTTKSNKATKPAVKKAEPKA